MLPDNAQIAEDTALFMGIALYHCGQYEMSERYLGQIEQKSAYQMEASSYLAWIEGKRKS